MKPLAKTANRFYSTLFLSTLLISSVVFAEQNKAETKPLSPEKPATLILKNGKVYTDPGPHTFSENARTWSQAISVRGEDLVTIGTNTQVLKEANGSTQIIDLNGRLVIPGFNDCGARIEFPSTDAFLRFQDDALKQGLTSIQGGPLTSSNATSYLVDAYRQKKLKIRLTLFGDLEKPTDWISVRNKYKDVPPEWIRFFGVYGTIDGELEMRTAALNDTYNDEPLVSGQTRYTQERLNELVLAANRLGLPVTLRATGDRAVSMALAAFAHARKQLFNARFRNRIESAEILNQPQIDRLSDFNLVACVSPNRMTDESKLRGLLTTKVLKEKLKAAFPLAQVERAKVKMTFGSNWPNGSLSPLEGIQGALMGTPWSTGRFSLDHALEAYSFTGAYSTIEDHLKGSLREGKFSDFVILEKNIFSIPVRDISKASVFMTIVNGKVEYSSQAAISSLMPVAGN